MSVPTAPLLVELRCEEMPPQLAPRLAGEFCHSLVGKLVTAGFLPSPDSAHLAFSTPRRLAALVAGVRRRSATPSQVRRGPSRERAYDATGAPTKALAGFLASNNGREEDLFWQADGRGKTHACLQRKQSSRKLGEVLGTVLEQVLRGMNAPRQMRWGNGDWQFVRPVRGVCAVHGKQAVKGGVLGLPVDGKTKGHRFLAPGEFSLRQAAGYADELRARKVLVSRAERQEKISVGMTHEFAKLGIFASADSNATIGAGTANTEPPSPKRPEPRLLAELADMCEWPAIYGVSFSDREFVASGAGLDREGTPAILVKTCVTKHLRGFAELVRVDGGGTSYHFWFVADNEFARPAVFRRGLRRVVRTRVADALFMYRQDSALDISELCRRLGGFTYVKGFGSLRARGRRLAELAEFSAREIWRRYGSEPDRQDLHELKVAAELCQVDHGTMTYAEYPELEAKLASIYLTDDLLNDHLRGKRGCNGAVVRDLVGARRSASGSPAEWSRTERSRWHAEGLQNFGHGIMQHSLRLADHVDRLVTFAVLDRLPTGAGDPAGLRNSVYEVVKVLGYFRGLQLHRFLDKALGLVGTALKEDGGDTAALARCEDGREGTMRKLRKLLLRPEDLMTRQHERYAEHYAARPGPAMRSSWPAVLGRPGATVNHYDLGWRVLALDLFCARQPDDYNRLLAVAKRLDNIVRKAGRRAAVAPLARATSGLVAAEKDLEAVTRRLEGRMAELDAAAACPLSQAGPPRCAPEGNGYFAFLGELVEQDAPVARFFRDVTVNSDVPEERERRLALVGRLHQAFNYVADMRRLYS